MIGKPAHEKGAFSAFSALFFGQVEMPRMRPAIEAGLTVLLEAADT
jgi:hypothetical protein